MWLSANCFLSWHYLRDQATVHTYRSSLFILLTMLHQIDISQCIIYHFLFSWSAELFPLFGSKNTDLTINSKLLRSWFSLWACELFLDIQLAGYLLGHWLYTVLTLYVQLLSKESLTIYITGIVAMLKIPHFFTMDKNFSIILLCCLV